MSRPVMQGTTRRDAPHLGRSIGQKATRHVVVVGGGIGGLFAAYAAGRQGLAVTVLERAAAFGEIGAGLQLAPNATRILKRYGLLDAVLEVGVLPRRLVLADAVTTDELTSLDLTSFDSRFGGPYVVVHRGDLHAILVEACRSLPSVTLQTGAEVVDVVEPGDGSVLVRCADGATVAGDVVIGADGLWSRVRRALDPTDPVCSGYVAYRGAVPSESVIGRSDDSDVVAYLGRGLHFVQYPLRGGAFYNQVAVFRSERFAAGHREWGTPEELDAAFAVTHERLRSALGSIDRTNRWAMYDRDPLPTWTSGRLALLGDAAHPMLQYLAQGACQGLMDGDCLAHALGQAADRGRDLVDAFVDYEEHRLDRASNVQRNARLWGDMWHADGVTRVLMEAYMRERDPGDLRHVAPLYGVPQGCGHSEPSAATHPASGVAAGQHPHIDAGASGLVPMSPSKK